MDELALYLLENSEGYSDDEAGVDIYSLAESAAHELDLLEDDTVPEYVTDLARDLFEEDSSFLQETVGEFVHSIMMLGE